MDVSRAPRVRISLVNEKLDHERMLLFGQESDLGERRGFDLKSSMTVETESADENAIKLGLGLRQVADIFTNGFPTTLFEDFYSSQSIQSPHAPTVGEC